MIHVPKILVVDDEPNNRHLIVTILTYQGHQLFEAADGHEGLSVAKEQRPDLIIMDLFMPGMSGTAFIKALRSDTELARTTVALYTGTATNAAMQTFLEITGIRHVIPKPSEPEDVMRVVETALHDRQ